MKTPKTLETKLRSALRLIWSRSGERRAILSKALYKKADGVWYFKCSQCQKEYHKAMAEVDHIDAVGPLYLGKITEWFHKLFYSPQRVIDKICHAEKTKLDRKAMREAK